MRVQCKEGKIGGVFLITAGTRVPNTIPSEAMNCAVDPVFKLRPATTISAMKICISVSSAC
jgi:hypothetical protein